MKRVTLRSAIGQILLDGDLFAYGPLLTGGCELSPEAVAGRIPKSGEGGISKPTIGRFPA